MCYCDSPQQPLSTAVTVLYIIHNRTLYRSQRFNSVDDMTAKPSKMVDPLHISWCVVLIRCVGRLSVCLNTVYVSVSFQLLEKICQAFFIWSGAIVHVTVFLECSPLTCVWSSNVIRAKGNISSMPNVLR